MLKITPVWPLSLSLAATNKIDVSFSSSGYLDQALYMRGAAVDVDVKAIGRGIDHAHVGTERVKHRLGHRGSRAVEIGRAHV